MIQINIDIESTGLTQFQNLEQIVRRCDELRHISDDIRLNITLASTNVSTLINNPLNPKGTLDSLYADLDDSMNEPTTDTDHDN